MDFAILIAGSAILLASLVYLRSFVRFRKGTTLLFAAFEGRAPPRARGDFQMGGDEAAKGDSGRGLSRRHIIPLFGILAAAWAALAALKRPHG